MNMRTASKRLPATAPCAVVARQPRCLPAHTCGQRPEGKHHGSRSETWRSTAPVLVCQWLAAAGLLTGSMLFELKHHTV
jgi:hypothetical protein